MRRIASGRLQPLHPTRRMRTRVNERPRALPAAFSHAEPARRVRLARERHPFPNLRTFIQHLRRDRDLAVVEAPVDARLEAAEIHRRVIAAGGPALLFTRVKGADFPLVTNLFGTPRRAEAAFAGGQGGSSAGWWNSARRCCRPRQPSCGARATWPRGAAHWEPARAARPGHGGRPRRRAPRPPARADLLARGRRPVRDSSAGLHEHPQRPAPAIWACIACTCMARDGRACTGRSARAAASTTRSRSRRTAAARDRVPGRAARADPGGHRAAARERARADAGFAHRRRAPAPGARPRAARARGRGRVRPHGPRPAARAPARRPFRRPLRLLLAAPRLPRVRDRAPGAPA